MAAGRGPHLVTLAKLSALFIPPLVPDKKNSDCQFPRPRCPSKANFPGRLGLGELQTIVGPQNTQ